MPLSGTSKPSKRPNIFSRKSDGSHKEVILTPLETLDTAPLDEPYCYNNGEDTVGSPSDVSSERLFGLHSIKYDESSPGCRRARSLSRSASPCASSSLDAPAQNNDNNVLHSMHNDIRDAIGGKNSTGVWLPRRHEIKPSPISLPFHSDHPTRDIELGLMGSNAPNSKTGKEVSSIFIHSKSSSSSSLSLSVTPSPSPAKHGSSSMMGFSKKVKGLVPSSGGMFGQSQHPQLPEHSNTEYLETQLHETLPIPTELSFSPKTTRLYGKSLRLFGPHNTHRNRCLAYLQTSVHTQGMKILLILQAALLAYRQWNPKMLHGFVVYGLNWADWVIFFLNVLYTIENVMNAIAWGLWDDSQMFEANGLNYTSFNELSGINRLKRHFMGRQELTPERKEEASRRTQTQIDIYRDNLNEFHRAYLRSSWNRVELLSTVCFWISAILSIKGINANSKVPLFRAISCLRILKIVTIVPHMTLILKSIKIGWSQLTDVLLFLTYFWCLFSIIGVQSFKSSLRRVCVWTNPNDPNDTYISSQHCGGHFEIVNGSLQAQPFIIGESTGRRAKGFFCAVNSRCETLENPNGSAFAFDNILTSMQLTFIIMSGNTFSDIMYDIMDTDSVAACLFFIAGIFLLLLWLTNLLIAVIFESFKVVRETQAPSETNVVIDGDFNLDWKFQNRLGQIYIDMKILFDIPIVVSLVTMCLIDMDTTESHMKREFLIQAICSCVLLLEIFIRFLSYFPRWRIFFFINRNNLDLLLAIITSVICIPGVNQTLGSMVYNWLRFFYLVRAYRLIIQVNFTRRLWAKVWKNMITIWNLSCFFFLFLFLVSIIFARYFENFASDSDIERIGQFPFHTLPNVFLGLFTVTTTENWSGIMYELEEIAPSSVAAFFTGVFFILWLILSNSVILNVFIAIITDSLSVSETEKRKEQVRKFILVDFPMRLKAVTEDYALIDFRSRFFLSRSQGSDDKNREIQNLLLNGAAVQVFLKDELNQLEEIGENLNEYDNEPIYPLQSSRVSRLFQRQYRHFINSSAISGIRKLFQGDSKFKNNPFLKKRNLLKSLGDENFNSLAEKYLFETEKSEKEKVEYLKENPRFNMTFYFLRPENTLRRLCQRITPSSYGRRYGGVEPSKITSLVFTVTVSLLIILMILVTCWNTPLYQKSQNYLGWNWTTTIELLFGILFLIELLIKVIADGFIFTPNAYLKNVWNSIDIFVLISIWTNILALIKGNSYLSRFQRGLKALRALRLLTITERSKDIFQNVMIAGFGKIVAAAFFSFTLLLPFSIWGLNLFSGTLGFCNDGDLGYDGCVNEFITTAFAWDILAPRTYQQPQLQFNNFTSSLLTLFEMISLEGWTDLLLALTSTTGVGQPVEMYASPENSIFLVLFIFASMIFIMAFFVSVIINSYSALTGSAYLTLEQTSWIEVRKLLGQINPRARPLGSNLGKFRTFCFKYTVQKNTYVDGAIFSILWITILAILLEQYPSNDSLDNFRYAIYNISSTILLTLTSMKIIAVSPGNFFRNKWNIYQFIVIFGAFVTTLAAWSISTDGVFASINKLFLTGMCTILIHVSSRLNHLLKIVSASIPSLLPLIFTWAVMLLVFAIALNQVFGLTRLGPNTTNNINLRTVPKAMIVLFRNSFGEGWNYIMNDFTVNSPFCVDYDSLNATDCGTIVLAYILFIAWNIFSMYIFVNMFISLILESFSYVYTNNPDAIALDREEIRKFKTCWQMFDTFGSGYIEPDQLPSFIRSLDGYFGFNVFDKEWSVQELVRKWRIADNFNSIDPYRINLDMKGLDKMLSKLDVNKAQKRRLAYDRLIEEAKLNMELFQEPGISFRRLILQIPLYVRFDETNCLTLTEFLDRLVVSRKLNKRVQNRRQLNTFKMIIHRWRFLKFNQPKKVHEYIIQKKEQEIDSSQSTFQTPVFKNRGSVIGNWTEQFSPVNNDSVRDNMYWSPGNVSDSLLQLDGEYSPLDEPLNIEDISLSLENTQWRNELESVNVDFENFLQTSRNIHSRLRQDENTKTDGDRDTNQAHQHKNPFVSDSSRKLT